MTFWPIPVAASLLTLVVVVLVQKRSWRREHAAQLAALAQAQQGIAAAAEAPIHAPLSGRMALAWHLEVIVRERVNRGSVEEITVRRIFQDALGTFALKTATGTVIPCSLEHAQLLEGPTAQPIPNVTLFASSTSAFARAQVMPPQVEHFLRARGLPMPSADSAVTPGLLVVVNERVVVPDAPLWFTPGESPCFGLGSPEATRGSYRFGLLGALYSAAILAVLVGIVAAVVCGAVFE